MTNCEPRQLPPVTATIFEELGFLTPTLTVSEGQRTAALDGSASVDFEGPVSGRLMVRLYGGVLPALAANMLGEWEAPSAEMQRDALGELANVLCGNLLRALHGSRAVFHLQAPSLPAMKVADSASATQRAVLGIENGRTEVELYLRAGAAAGAA